MPDHALPPIAYGDLLERLSDPESDLDHYLKYLIEVPVPGRMGPELEPNPALVTEIPPQIEGGAIISLANGFMRRRRHQKYRRRIRSGWTGPRIISEGDSWFQYPTSLQEIIDHLMVDHAILSLGAAGDELSDIRRQREILLNIEAEGASALLLSAGGNDLFDSGQLGKLIEPPFPGATGEDLVGATFEAFLSDMVAQYLDLFRRVHRAFPEVHILIHGYGPAFPRGGSWIEKPLTKRGVPRETQHEVVQVILRRFNQTLATLAARPEFHGRVAHIDVTDIGTDPGDWHDEIHLDGPNFALAADRFRQELKRRLDGPRVESAVATVATMVPAQIPVMEQAANLAALDQSVLLRELDLRVGLLELDPTAADDGELPLLFTSRAETEIGIASLRRATRRLIDRWMSDLRDVVCGGADPDNAFESAIVAAMGQSKTTLAAALAGWLVTGPLAVPMALGSALAAWLAGELLEAGREGLCATWKPLAAPPAMVGAVETAGVTVGEMRARFRTPVGLPDFSADHRRDELEILDDALASSVIEPPLVPVDADGASLFRARAEKILEMLGGEPDDTPVDDSDFGVAEAFVLTDGTRPALYVRDGTIDVSDPLLDRSGWLDEVTAVKDDVHRLIHASGRIIEGADRSANRVYGTAWMLSDGRVATAKHVLEAMSIKVGETYILKNTFFVDFAVEADRPVRTDTVFRIEALDFASPDLIAGTVNPAQLDVAVFNLVPRDDVDFPDPIPLASDVDGAAILADKKLYNVGHPAAPRGSWLVDDEDDDPNTVSKALVTALIGDRFGVKRFSPGMIDVAPGMFPGDARKHVITHEATTLGGSSGSGMMATGTSGAVMVGLHFAGLFGTRNYAHWVPAISEPLK